MGWILRISGHVVVIDVNSFGVGCFWNFLGGEGIYWRVWIANIAPIVVGVVMLGGYIAYNFFQRITVKRCR